MVLLRPEERAALEEELHPSPPRFTGKGLRVGVFADGFGSQGIIGALRKMEGVEVKTAKALSQVMLGPCQVFVLPQIRGRGYTSAELKALRGWVRKGGRLLLTHDAVGFRGHEPPFPELARGVGNVRGVKFKFAQVEVDGWKSPSGGPFETTYYDLVTMSCGPAGTVVARAVGGKGEPAAVLGAVGKGRVFATGVAIGLALDNTDAPPTPGEVRMLRAALRWLRQ
jgi:GNAT superfamily N-acetyltransferase